ncbi:hypothetical protein GO613_00455 [Azoarcus communis]|uniref:toprim domain-containing protein n=1 Tax=Parazoarcus communis TaxID=41977 RepID=UPI0014594280|nr:toprim domain-containing protein [Parazoarcus communis]NMG46580.1 hypothetical protein [Parazoarcus communis]
MSDFTHFAHSHGVEIGDLYASDRIRRCPTTAHPRSRNGAYWFDGQRGWVQNWEHGDAVQWWNDPHARPWTEADKAAWAAKRRAAQAERRAAQQRAAAKAADLLACATPAEHGYLRAKGFADLKGLTVDDGGTLIVPMRDLATNAIVGAQRIFLEDNRWKKRYLSGQRTTGAVFVLGQRNAAETWLVEGFATGLSVERALRQLHIQARVVVTFSASNLQHCAEHTAGRRFVFADNDESETGQKAAATTGLRWVMSSAVGEDANDLHQRAGIFAVCQKIMGCRKSAAPLR